MDRITVNTGFNVQLQVDVDTAFRRIIAFIIDFFIILLYFFLVFIKFLNIDIEGLSEGELDRINWGISSLLFLPIMFYSLLWEVITGGMTLGKYITGIKVVKKLGYQPNFTDYFIRWIFRIIDIYVFIFILILTDSYVSISAFSFTGWIALITIVINRKGQRLGDIVAGTTVARKKLKQDISITILSEVQQDYKPIFPEVIKLSDNDMRIIKDTYMIAMRNNDFDTIEKLRIKVKAVTGIEVDMYYKDFFDAIIKDFNYYTKDLK